MVLGTSQSIGSPPLHLGVFLKAPEPGRVKTRLAADLGNVAACDLYRKLVHDTLEWVIAAKNLRPVVFFSPSDRLESCRGLLPPPEPGPAASRSTPTRKPVEFVPQEGETLGQRMSAALGRLFSLGAEKAALIGTDCPLLGPDQAENARTALDRHDLVLGPSNDGGYYLIGMRDLHPELFVDVEWSTDKVLPTTRARAQAAGLSLAELETLTDIDSIDDLRQIEEQALATSETELTRGPSTQTRGHLPRRTFEWLRRRGERAGKDPTLRRKGKS